MMKMWRIILFCPASLMLLVAAKPVPISADLLLLWSPKELRIKNILHRISVANTALCKDQSAQTGMTMRVNYGSFAKDFRAAQMAAFGPGAYPKIDLVVPGGPADQAGLRQGDEVISFNARAIMPNISDESDLKKWTAIVKTLSDDFEAQAAAPPTQMVILRSGKQHNVTLRSVPGCKLFGQLRVTKELNAANSGNNIFVSSALLDFAPDDNEVASVIAHEAAHAILEHYPSTSDRPTVEKRLKDPKFRKPAEVEADRLGVQLMANAGFDPYAAARYYSRWSAQRGSIEKLIRGFNKLYLNPKERLAFLQKRAEEIDPERKLASQ